MNIFAEAIRWFGGRGGVPPEALPTEPPADPVRATAELAEEQEAYQEPEQFDPYDTDKWPPGSPPRAIDTGPWTPIWNGIQARSVVLEDDAGFYYRIEANEELVGREGPIYGPFRLLSEARAEAEMDMEGLLPLPEVDGPDPDPDLRTRLGSQPTATMGPIITRALEHITRDVPQGLSADDLLKQADQMAQEASFEAGWDNYSTAAHLRQRAEHYRLAAAIGNSLAPQEVVTQYITAVTNRILDKVTLEEDGYDVGADASLRRTSLDRAIGQIPVADMHKIINELAADGRLSHDDAEGLHIDQHYEHQFDAGVVGVIARQDAGIDHDDDLGH